MQSIDFAPLNSRRREIRLLELCSETLSGSLQLAYTLRAVSLLDNPEYIALSYTWGAATPPKIIQINGKAIAVGANLEAALSQIRQDGGAVTLWVDAICINQKNVEERTQQVQIMRDIYAQAQHVLAWLGVAADDSDTAIDLLNSIGERAIEAGIFDLRGNDLVNLFNPGGEERLSSLKASLDACAETPDLNFFHPSLNDFSERAYWRRTWIIQEISVAREVVLLCGSKKLSLRTFSAASNFCGYARQRRARHVTLEEWMDPVRGSLLRASMARAPSSAPNTVFGIRRRYQGETGNPAALYDLLKRTCFVRPSFGPCQATDGRDKIYGLLGLEPPGDQLGLTPDYGRTTQEAYTAATRAFIARGEVNILAWSQRHKAIGGLPSWVPDFSSPLHQPCGENDLTGSTEQIYFASGSQPVTILAHESPSVIGFRAVSVDRIHLVGTPWLPDVNGPFDFQAAAVFFNEIEHFCDLSQKRGFKLTLDKEKWAEATWRIPCADQEAKSSGRARASPAVRSPYLELKKGDFSNKSVDRIGYMKVMRSLYERRPFISTEGWVGLAPTHVQQGDRVCIILGGSFPFVLRGSPSGQYELVGEAYVHGIMDGEGLELGREAESMWLC